MDAMKQKKIDEVKVSFPVIYSHYTAVTQTCNVTFLNVCREFSKNASTFCLLRSDNSAAVLHALRQALFQLHKLSETTLLRIAVKITQKKQIVYMDDIRWIARHLESKIDAGDEYVVIQADCRNQQIPKKRPNVIFELHAFRRYFARKCGRPGCREQGNRLLPRCGSCWMVYYCSPACQRQHWKTTHRFTCVPSSAADVTRLLGYIGKLHPARKFHYGEHVNINMKPSSISQAQHLEKWSLKLADQ